MKALDYLILAAAIGLGGYGLYSLSHTDQAAQPSKPATPTPPANPCPDDKCPKPRPKPWDVKVPAGRQAPRHLAAWHFKYDWAAVGDYLRENPIRHPFGAKVSGPKFDDGTELACDYPGERHRKNTSSKGLGLCVFTSIHHAADWQDIPALLEMPKWMIEKGIAGGGYPQKVAQLVPRLSQERGQAPPEMIQVENYDYEILRLACDGGRMPCVTYSRSPTGRYNGSRISHMVNVVHADEKYVVVLDNNYVGYNAFEWMTKEEFRQAGGLEWAVIFTSAPPPPPPHDGTPRPQTPESPEFRPDAGPKPLIVDAPPCGKEGCRCGCKSGDNCRCVSHETKAKKPKKGQKVCPCSADCTCGCNEGEPCRCGNPAPRPAPAPAPDPDSWVTHGVIREKLVEVPRYRHGDFEVTRDDVIVALEKVPADSKKMRVTFIGDPAARARIEQDWKSDPEIAKVKDAFLYRSYDPGHWHVKGYGFGPGLTITDHTGKELHYSKEYQGAPATAETLRRLRPDYRPGGTILDPSKNFPTKTAAAVGAAALIGYFALRRRQN